MQERVDELTDRLGDGARRVAGLWARLSALKPVRVYLNFSHNDGNLMAAGMSYQTLFASFAGIWVGFSIAGIWLKSFPALEDELISLINTAIPNLIGQDGLIPRSALPTGLTFGWTGAIAIAGLLWTAIAWLFYTRQAVRAMFGLERDTTSYILQKARDLVLAVAFGGLLLIAAVASFVSIEAVELVVSIADAQAAPFVSQTGAQLAGFGVSLALNLVVLAAMFRLLSRVAIPWRDLFAGSLLGSIALSAVSAVGGLIVSATSRNPLLTTFAVFIGLLVWFILICRIILLAASWIAVGMADKGISPRRLTPSQRAAEAAATERDARLIIARADLAAAKEALRSARWPHRGAARRRVRHARERLDELLDRGIVRGGR
jgi:membrane protein